MGEGVWGCQYVGVNWAQLNTRFVTSHIWTEFLLLNRGYKNQRGTKRFLSKAH